MTASQTIESRNLLDVTVNNNTSKVSSANYNSDSDEFGKVFDSVSKNYSDEKPVKKQETPTNKEKIEYTNKENSEQETSVNDDNKEVQNNSEKASGEISDNKRQEEKINQKNKDNSTEEKASNDDIEIKNDDLKQEIVDDIVAKNTDVSKLDLDKDLKANIERVSDVESIPVKVKDFTLQDVISEMNPEQAIKTTTSPQQEVIANISSETSVSELSIKATLTETKTDSLIATANNNEILPKQSLMPNKELVAEPVKVIGVEVNSSEQVSALKQEIKADTNMLKTEIPEQAPAVKVSNDAIASLKIADSEVKQNAKTALENTNLNQQKLDDLNVEITSVDNSNGNNSKNFDSNANPNNNGFLAQQNLQDQAVRLEIQTNSDVKMPEIQIQSQTESANTIDSMNNIAGMNTTKMLNNTQNVQQNVQIQTPKTLDSTDIMSQINKQIDAKALTDSGSTKVSIVLRPENLGKLELELVSTKQGLEAKMVASSPQVKEMLDKNLEILKETLVNQGVNVNNVTVKVSEAQKSDTMFSFDQHAKDGHTQEQQSQKTKKGESIAQNMEQDEENIDAEENVVTQLDMTEKTASINGVKGRVDYKI